MGVVDVFIAKLAIGRPDFVEGARGINGKFHWKYTPNISREFRVTMTVSATV
jgi:hypothetical protein